MIIKYNIEDKNYYLCDLGDGSGTFIKLDIPVVCQLYKNLLGIKTWIYNFIW